MIAKLILLGILNNTNNPLHGYEIKKILKEWFVEEYADISYGSIYYNLERMEKEGLVKGKTIKNSKRPERKLYRITEKGRTEFLNLLRKNYFEVEFEKIFFPFDVGVLFMPALTKDEVIKALNKRIHYIKNLLNEHRKIRSKMEDKEPFIALAIMDHHILHWKAELKWLESLKAKVEESKDLKDLEIPPHEKHS